MVCGSGKRYARKDSEGANDTASGRGKTTTRLVRDRAYLHDSVILSRILDP